MSLWPALEARLERLAERSNPLLLRELRQSLRGRFASVSFAIPGMALLIAAVLLLRTRWNDDYADLGSSLLSVAGVLATLCSGLIVPLHAFGSLAEEWEQDTMDGLRLSALSPAKLVRGKLLGSMVLALLLLSAFAPLFALAFLFPGVQLEALLTHALLQPLLAAYMCSLALLLGCLARVRALRIVLQILFALFLLQTWGALSALQSDNLFGGWSGHVVWAGLSLFLAVGIFAVCLAQALSVALLTHPESDRSGPVRLVVAGGVGFGVLWIAATALLQHDSDLVLEGGSALLLLLFLPAALFGSEPERLGRQARLGVASAAGRVRWAPCFAPGGGRGLLWLALMQLMILVPLSLTLVWLEGSGAALLPLPTAMVFPWIFVGVPTLILARWTKVLALRAASGLLCVGLALAWIVIPYLGDFLFTGTVSRSLWNPFELLPRMSHPSAEDLTHALLMALLATLLVAANLSRMRSGWSEYAQAAAARRELEAQVATQAGTNG